MDFIKSYIADKGFVFLLGLVLVGAGLAFFLLTIKNRPGKVRVFGVFFTLILGLFLTWRIPIIVERIHLLEYGILGWFTGRDLIGKEKKIKGIVLACVFCACAGVIDELFQGILPYRYFDWRDIGLNSLGGIWGIILFILVKVKCDNIALSGRNE